jgi:hypothetical protein
MIPGWRDKSCKVKHNHMYNRNNLEQRFSHTGLNLREGYTVSNKLKDTALFLNSWQLSSCYTIILVTDHWGIFKTHNVLGAHSPSSLHITGCKAEQCNPVVKCLFQHRTLKHADITLLQSQ